MWLEDVPWSHETFSTMVQMDGFGPLTPIFEHYLYPTPLVCWVFSHTIREIACRLIMIDPLPDK